MVSVEDELDGQLNRQWSAWIINGQIWMINGQFGRPVGSLDGQWCVVNCKFS